MCTHISRRNSSFASIIDVPSARCFCHSQCACVRFFCYFVCWVEWTYFALTYIALLANKSVRTQLATPPKSLTASAAHLRVQPQNFSSCSTCSSWCGWPVCVGECAHFLFKQHAACTRKPTAAASTTPTTAVAATAAAKATIMTFYSMSNKYTSP